MGPPLRYVRIRNDQDWTTIIPDAQAMPVARDTI
jgi:hypothetical protein